MRWNNDDNKTNNIEYTFHTYYNTTLTVYKIYTDSEDHLKNIDKIMRGIH